MTSSAWMIAWGPPWVPFDTLRNWFCFLIDHPKLIEIYKCAPKLLAEQLTSKHINWIGTSFFFCCLAYLIPGSNDQPRQVFVFTSVWWKLRSSLALSWHVHRRADLALWESSPWTPWMIMMITQNYFSPPIASTSAGVPSASIPCSLVSPYCSIGPCCASDWGTQNWPTQGPLLNSSRMNNLHAEIHS